MNKFVEQISIKIGGFY